MKRRREDRREGSTIYRATVTENDEQELFDAIHEQLIPHAVAAIASCLRINRTDNAAARPGSPQDVDRQACLPDGQVHWFAEELCKLLGGYEPQSRLAEELGL